MDILVSFEVSHASEEFIDSLKELGYRESWRYDERHYFLPENTLWKKNTNMYKVLEELESMAKKLELVLLKAVAVPADPWHALEQKKA